ncbi:hypothetical protein NEAUS04_0641 [Nematocida ausubeli]|nr:hypothetical protein NEAUS04_0641 [Nematocida ausubeli]
MRLQEDHAPENCKICHTPEERNKALITPCKCTIKVHSSCMLAIIHKTHQETCPNCAHPMKLKKLYCNKTYATLKNTIKYIKSIFRHRRAPMVPPWRMIFHKISTHIRYTIMRTIRMDHLNILYDKINKLIILQEYNDAFINHTRIIAESTKSPVSLQNIFNVIIYEDTPNTTRINNPLINWSIFLQENILVTITTGIVPLLFTLYVIILGIMKTRGILNHRRYAVIFHILHIYSKICIMLWLRYVALPYGISRVITGFAVEIILILEKMAVLDRFMVLGVYPAYIHVIFGNLVIITTESLITEGFSHVIRPGLVNSLCPTELTLENIIKDRVITVICGYTRVLTMFIGFAAGLACTHLLFWYSRIYFQELFNFPKISEWQSPYLQDIYIFLLFLNLFFEYFPIRKTSQLVHNFLKNIPIFLSKILEINSFIFNEKILPDTNPTNLKYFPSKNIPYSHEEIKKRAIIPVTDDEKNIYFDGNGEIRKLTLSKFEYSEIQWDNNIITHRKAELLYNPMYSLYSVPKFWLFRVVIFIFSLSLGLSLIIYGITLGVSLFLFGLFRVTSGYNGLNRVMSGYIGLKSGYFGLNQVLIWPLVIITTGTGVLLMGKGRRLMTGLFWIIYMCLVPFISVVIYALINSCMPELMALCNVSFENIVWSMSIIMGSMVMLGYGYASVLFWMVRVILMLVYYNLGYIYIKAKITDISLFGKLIIVMFPYLVSTIFILFWEICLFIRKLPYMVISCFSEKVCEVVLLNYPDY